MQEQQCEQRPLPAAGKLDRSAVLQNLERPEDPELHPGIVRYRADTGNDCVGTGSWAALPSLPSERPQPAASTKITVRRLACTAGVALTALALATGSAAGGSGAKVCTARAQACMTEPEFRALMIRSVALNHKYGLGTD